MTMIFHYETKKELKENIGKPLRYTETSMFGAEYKLNGKLFGTNHPRRSWFASVIMKDGIIQSVK